jgi:two-component system, OmpR family, sensor histidine kinase KdpD
VTWGVDRDTMPAMATDRGVIEGGTRRRPFPWAGCAYAAALVAAAAAVSIAVHPFLNLADVVMIYILAIMVAAFAFGRWPSIVAAGLSVAAYDFFSVPPFFTFNVEAAKHFWTFAMMFGIGIAVSTLMDRIRHQKREAESAALRVRTEEMRSSLLSAVSHDLRTPLATIIGAGTALRDEQGRLGPGQRDELIETVCGEAERMERIVTNLLDMTRVDSHSLALKRDWVPLEEIVGSVLTRLEPRLADRRVVMHLPEDLPLVSVDPVLFGQVFVNLVDNALKYTPASSPIEIGAAAKADAIEIEVADRGPGVSAGSETRIFEKFSRGAHPGIGGVGLGLPVCRGIVEAHGGTIEARNRPDGGAVFRIRLPLMDAPTLKEPTP